MTVKLIVAVNSLGYIGNQGELLYSIPSDLNRFKQLTSSHTVLMGRKTWESLPNSVRPLPNRHNVIATRDRAFYTRTNKPNVQVIHNLDQYLLSNSSALKTIWIIGGSEIYKQALKYVGEVHVSVIKDDTVGDTKFNILPKGEFICTSSQDFPAEDVHPGYTYLIYVRQSQ